MEDIDVFFMDPTFIDLQVYALWLQGFSGEWLRINRNKIPSKAAYLLS